jgi:hypothetical protein
MDTGMKKISLYIASITLVFFLAGLAHAGGTNSLLVSATVLSKSNCKFTSATSAINFGTLNPANSTDVTASATITFRCLGSAPVATYAVTHDSGLYETAPSLNRMRHATITTEYLPYTLTLNPANGTIPKNTPQNLTITGTVRASDYQVSAAGAFSDSVVISINP